MLENIDNYKCVELLVIPFIKNSRAIIWGEQNAECSRRVGFSQNWGVSWFHDSDVDFKLAYMNIFLAHNNNNSFSVS